jgi:RNase H-fold protein (predicted Holliday junction resolvase)
MDERLSSWEAKQIISETNSRPRARRTDARRAASRKVSVDDVAAAVILRDYLAQARRLAGVRD